MASNAALAAMIGGFVGGESIRPLPEFDRAELVALGDRPLGRWGADQAWARSLSADDMRVEVIRAYETLGERDLIRVEERDSSTSPVAAVADGCAIVIEMRANPDTVTILGQDGIDDPLMMVSHCRLVDGADWCLVELRPSMRMSEFTLCVPEIASAVMVNCLTDRLGGLTRRLEMVDADLAQLAEVRVTAGPGGSVVVQDGSGESLEVRQLDALIRHQWSNTSKIGTI